MLKDLNSFKEYFLNEDILTDKNGVFRKATKRRRSGTFRAGIAKRVNKLRMTLAAKKRQTPPKPNVMNEGNDPIMDSFVMDFDYSDIYLVSDLHFFKKEANYHIPGNTKKMMYDFKKQVDGLGSNCLLIILGDISHKKCSPKQHEIVKNFFKNLNCTMILVKGNHEKLDDNYYKQCGFAFVVDELYLDNIIFTHQPVPIPKYAFEGVKYNIHGHLHGTNDYWNCEPKGHFDVWTVDNKLLNLNEIMKHMI